LAVVGQKGADGLNSDGRGFVFGEMVDAGADIGEGDGAEVVFHGQGQCVAVAIRQQAGLVMAAAVPDRSDGMDDPFGGKPAACGDDGLACCAAALFCPDGLAFGQDRRSACAMDGAVDAAPAEQGAVSRVDDGVGCHFRDVALEELDAGVHVSNVTETILSRHTWDLDQVQYEIEYLYFILDKISSSNRLVILSSSFPLNSLSFLHLTPSN